MTNYVTLKQKLILSGLLFEDAEFPASFRSIRLDGRVPSHLRWKRPHEICENPVFIRDGVSRFDMDQGRLGNCWFVAAVSSLASTNSRLLQRCVPHDQSFTREYAGIFHFHFWWFEEWVEVIIDDRLPTINGRLVYANNLEEPNEFWPALLEKAYAKLHKRYENLDGGHINNALVDFTGGISEVVSLKNPSEVAGSLFTLIFRTIQMNSMSGCSIQAKTRREVDLGNGLYTGHAYNINNMLQTTVNGKRVRLIRLQNPWGRSEWRGAWSDKSREWRAMSEDDRQAVGFVVRNDGEFWMDFDEWQNSFDVINFCHLHPDGFTDEVAKDLLKNTWRVSTVHDGWVKGFSAGGCGNSPDEELFWTNPQIAMKLHEADDENKDGRISTIISLMQKPQEIGENELFMGIMLYKVKPGRSEHLRGVNYRRDDVTPISSPRKFVNLREVTLRLYLMPGTYIIIPCTFHPNKDGNFLLRIFTESKAEASPVDEESSITRPHNNSHRAEELFAKYSGGDLQMDAAELQRALDEVFKEDIGDRGFGVEIARSLLAMMDTNRSGFLHLEEFTRMLKELEVWEQNFHRFDEDNTGSIDTYELARLFETIGFRLSRGLLSAIVRRYGGKQRRMDMVDFLLCCSRITVMYDRFIKWRRPESDGKAELSLSQWLGDTLI